MLQSDFGSKKKQRILLHKLGLCILIRSLTQKTGVKLQSIEQQIKELGVILPVFLKARLLNLTLRLLIFKMCLQNF